MKVLFVYTTQEGLSPKKPLKNADKIQFGISYISALLKRHKHQTRLLVLCRETPRNALEKALHDFKPGLVCFSAVFSEYKVICAAARRVAQLAPRAFRLAGGVHVSLNPEDCIGGPFAAICVGEGEYPTLELATALAKGRNPGRIRNLWIKRKGRIEKNPPRPFLTRLDRLPLPDRDIWRDWIKAPDESATVLLGRGCPYPCSYCCNQALKRLASGTYVRFHSPRRVVEEISLLCRGKNAPQRIHLEVESITANRKFAAKLCARLAAFNARRVKPVSFWGNIRLTARADLDSLFAQLKRAGFDTVNIGVESGSERLRRNVLKRNYLNQDILRAAEQAKRYGLKLCFYNMVGLPGEKPTDFKQTVAINRRCLPDSNYLSVF